MEKIRALNRILYSIGLHPPRAGNRILVCPRCGNKNIKLSSRFDAWLMPKRYVCEACGYIGPIVLEIDVEERQ